MSRGAAAAHWVWYGTGAAPAMVRAALAPAASLFGAVVARRNRRFDAGVGVEPLALPALSVGNLSVGGTGKTPVAAWCARELQRLGATPAVVLRGYGDDEWRVHTLLTPGAVVVTDADRVQGVAAAASRGADVAVLDDAFQHRRAARTADLVLVSADAWTGTVRLLPAGPWREPLSSLRRASVAVITVKTASEARVAEVATAVQSAAPSVPVAVVALAAGALHAVVPGASLDAVAAESGPESRAESRSESMPLDTLAGRAVTAVSAIADPAPFLARLIETGARVEARSFRDHHAFTAADIAELVASIPASGVAVCTLKDAVKLAPLWPRVAPPLLYVSQTIEVRLGADALHTTLARVCSARRRPHAASRSTAG